MSSKAAAAVLSSTVSENTQAEVSIRLSTIRLQTYSSALLGRVFGFLSIADWQSL